jgi:hypothetical protein
MDIHHSHRIGLLRMGLKAWGKKEDSAVSVVNIQIKHARVAKFTSVKGFAIGTTTGEDIHVEQYCTLLNPYYRFCTCGIVVPFTFSDVGSGDFGTTSTTL